MVYCIVDIDIIIRLIGLTGVVMNAIAPVMVDVASHYQVIAAFQVNPIHIFLVIGITSRQLMVRMMDMQIYKFVTVSIGSPDAHAACIPHFSVANPKMVPIITKVDPSGPALAAILIQPIKDQPINNDPRPIIVKIQDMAAIASRRIIWRNDDLLVAIGLDRRRSRPGPSPLGTAKGQGLRL